MDLDETREGKKRTKAVDKVKRQRLVWSGLVERLHAQDGTGIMGLAEQTILNSGSGRGSARAHGAKTEFGKARLENFRLVGNSAVLHQARAAGESASNRWSAEVHMMRAMRPAKLD